MDDRIESVAVDCLAVGRDVDEGSAREVLAHVDGYEPSAPFARRMAIPGTVTELDSDEVHWAVADHDPPTFDRDDLAPSIAYAGYYPVGVGVGFTVDPDHLDVGLAVLERAAAATTVRVAHLGVEFDVDADVRGDGTIADVDDLAGYLGNWTVDRETGRSEVGLSPRNASRDELRGGEDVAELRREIEDRLAETTEYVEGLLP